MAQAAELLEGSEVVARGKAGPQQSEFGGTVSDLPTSPGGRVFHRKLNAIPRAVVLPISTVSECVVTDIFRAVSGKIPAADIRRSGTPSRRVLGRPYAVGLTALAGGDITRRTNRRHVSRSGSPASVLACNLLLCVACLSVLVNTGCVSVHDPIPWDHWKDSYPDHYARPLGEKARAIDRHLLDHHLASTGVLVYSRVCQHDQPESAEEIYDNVADQTIWTGALAATYALKFRSTGDPADRERMLRVLGGLKLLHDVTGKPGLFARAIHPADRPLRGERDHQEWRPGRGVHVGFRYRGAVSKDQYFGILFGYATVVTELGIDTANGDPDVRALILEPARAVADHIWANDLNIVDADGERTKHGDLAGYFLGIPIGPNAQLALGFQLLAYRLSAEPRFRERYEELLERGYAEATGNTKFEIFGRTNHNNDNMAMMGLFSLTRLERDPTILSTYDTSLADLWRLVRHEGNTFFHLVCASRYRLPEFARFDLLENLRLLAPDPRIYGVDVTDHPAVERAWFNNRFGIPKNRTALPLHLRPRSSFVWTRCPFALVKVISNPGERCVSGVDFLLAYWLAVRLLGDPDGLSVRQPDASQAIEPLRAALGAPPLGPHPEVLKP